MEYLLFVIMITSNPYAIEPQEFKSKESCEYARQVIQLELEEYLDYPHGLDYKTICIKK